MRASQFKDWLKSQFPDVKFYNGAVTQNDKQCVSIYSRGTASPYIAVGGAANTSFAYLPITVLVHWSENADECEQMATQIYQKLFGVSKVMMGTTKVNMIKLLDPCPVNIDRDDKNIAEMVIRLQLIYER